MPTSDTPTPERNPFIPAALDDYGLHADDFRVACRVLRRGECTEGVKGIAEGCHLSERQVRYAIRVLLACKIIEQEQRIGTTSILRVRPIKQWNASSKYATTRQAIHKGDPEKKSVRKTPALDAEVQDMQEGVLHQVQGGTAQNDRGVLHQVQWGTASGAAKGTPIKVLPEGTPGKVLATADAAQSEIPEKEGTPGRRMLNLYQSMFVEKFERQPNIQWGKDGKIMKTLVEKYGEGSVADLLARFFVSVDQFVLKSGYTVGIFNTQINSLLVEQAKPPPLMLSAIGQKNAEVSKQYLERKLGNGKL